MIMQNKAIGLISAVGTVRECERDIISGCSWLWFKGRWAGITVQVNNVKSRSLNLTTVAEMKLKDFFCNVEEQFSIERNMFAFPPK